MKLKSLKTQFIGAIAMVLVAAVAMGSSTYAWFTLNNRVTASNMQVKAKTAGSLVITDTSALPAASTTSTDWRFTDAQTELLASTHDWAVGTTMGLKFVTNPQNINPETGTQRASDAGLSFDDADNDATHTYFKVFGVFIASSEEELTGQDVTVTLDGVLGNAAEINKAISVDFYGGPVSAVGTLAPTSGNYLDTLNVAGVKNNGTATANSAYAEFTISNIDIPKADGTAAYAVTMVVYYDGALVEKAGTNAYTVYEQLASGSAPSTNAPYYYRNNDGTGIASVGSGDSVAGLYVVDYDAGATGTSANGSASAMTYARTVEIANLADVTLQAAFVAEPHV